MRRVLGALLGVLLCVSIADAQGQSQSARASLSSSTCPGTGCVALSVQGVGGVAVQVSGTFSGTLTFETSVDGVNFNALTMYPTNSTTGVTTTTSTGQWQAGVGGFTIVQVRFSSYASGSAVVSVQSAPTTARSFASGGGGIAGTLADTQVAVGSAANTVSGSGVLAYRDVNTSSAVLPVTARKSLQVGDYGCDSYGYFSPLYSCMTLTHFPDGFEGDQLYLNTTYNLDSNAPNAFFAGIGAFQTVGASTSANIYAVHTVDFRATHYGSGTVSQLENVDGVAQAYAGTVTTMTGVKAWNYVDGTANVGASYGIYARSGNYGAGTVTTDASIFVEAPDTGGTITTHYGIKLEDQETGGTSYSLYSGNGLVHFGAQVEIVGLKTTGAATGKKVVCVDTTTGQLYASSTGTDCSN